MHFGHTVGGCAVDGCAVENAVDLVKVVGGNASDASLGVNILTGCGCGGGVPLSRVAQGAERCGDVKGGGGQVASVARDVGAVHSHGVSAILVDQGVGQCQAESACSHITVGHGVAVGADYAVGAGKREAERVARFAARGQLDLVLQAVGQFVLVDAIDGFGQAEHRRRDGACTAVCVLTRGQGVECEDQRGAGFAGVARHVGGGGGDCVGAVFCDLVRRHGDGGGTVAGLGAGDHVAENTHRAVGRGDCDVQCVTHN